MCLAPELKRLTVGLGQLGLLKNFSQWSLHMVPPAGHLQGVQTSYVAVHGSKGMCPERAAGEPVLPF